MIVPKPVATALLALSAILIGCQPLGPAARPAASPIPTDVPAPPLATFTCPTQSLPPTPTPEFQRLSLASIMRSVPTEVTIQASLFGRESCMRLEIDTIGFHWSPGAPQESGLVREIALLDRDTGAPLTAEEVVRGGGGGGGDGTLVTMQDSFTYDVKSALPGRVTVMVTFHEALGITQPVRFDLELTLRPNMYCPQLPPTTPEG